MKLFSSVIFSLILVLGIGFAFHANAQVAVPVGCTSTGGYSTATGMPCNSATTIPLGCTSTAGFSGATGMPCNGSTAAANGYGGATVGPNGFLSGCASTGGYSATTGYSCNMSINGVLYTGNGTSVNTGPAPVPTTVSPGLPTTGAGNNTLVNIALLLASAGVAFAATRYAIRHSTN
jgi:hypothetical protein